MERDLFEPIKTFFEEQGYVCDGEVNDIDIFMQKEDDSVAVELKQTLDFRAIQQAALRQYLKLKNVHFNWHESQLSMLEACISRGDRRIGDVIYAIRDHGIVPDAEMPGLNYGTERHQHGELIAGLKGYMNGILKNPNRKLSSAWLNGLKGILAAYLGPIPEKFNYKGVEYTPESYLKALNLNPDDYVDFTSWTHLSYYEKHPVEVADNWRWTQSWNLPLDEFVSIIDYAINNGYTVAWASDVSEQGFTRNGIGLVPDMDAIKKQAEEAGSDQAHWLGITAPGARPNFDKPVPELTITPEMRQQGYEEKTTTDDHGMHIYGIAKDQNGNKYYMVKNSWGETGKYKGIWYVSEAYVRYKTMDLMVHKDAIPKDIKKKIGIK